MPAALARRPWWVGLLKLSARRLLPKVRTRGLTRYGRRQWYGTRRPQIKTVQEVPEVVRFDGVHYQ